LALLLDSLDAALASHQLVGRVLIVDDGSTTRPAPKRAPLRHALELVEVLRLRRNLGHQRAIAVGLCHLVEHRDGSGIIIMDGDGQDQPTDIPRLLGIAADRADDPAVFAGRLRRSEGMMFAFFYHLYRLLHRLLTGVAVRMGNFSYLPWHHADRLVVCSELWNHYAAAVVHSRVPYALLPTERGTRLTGESSMNLVGLVAHGLSAMAVFSDRIGARALAVSGAALTVALLSLITVLGVRWGTALALPGWATTAAGLLVVFVAQIVMLSTLFTFVVLSGRSHTAVIPLRDYRVFVREVGQW
jgi:glycosyltransferase involved in cell wall biosynthesis